MAREVQSEGEAEPGSTLLRYRVRDGKRFVLVVHQGKEATLEISADALSIFLQDVGRYAG